MSWWQTLLVLVAALAAVWLGLLAVLWVNRPTRDLVGPAARLLPDLAGFVRSLMADRSTPRSVKVALAVVLIWIVSPIDLIPEFVPVLGPLDDVVVTALVLRWCARRIGRERLRTHWSGSAEGWAILERLL